MPKKSKFPKLRIYVKRGSSGQIWTSYAYDMRGSGQPDIALGTDRDAALRRVLELLGESDSAGTIGRLWQQYRQTPAWADLRPRTQADYAEYSAPLLAVFEGVRAADITAPDVARYLRIERRTTWEQNPKTGPRWARLQG